MPPECSVANPANSPVLGFIRCRHQPFRCQTVQQLSKFGNALIRRNVIFLKQSIADLIKALWLGQDPPDRGRHAVKTEAFAGIGIQSDQFVT